LVFLIHTDLFSYSEPTKFNHKVHNSIDLDLQRVSAIMCHPQGYLTRSFKTSQNTIDYYQSFIYSPTDIKQY